MKRSRYCRVHTSHSLVVSLFRNPSMLLEPITIPHSNSKSGASRGERAILNGSRQILIDLPTYLSTYPLQALHPVASNSCMPHGHLTPLGHRLRSVLATLRPNARHVDNGSTASKQQLLPSKALYTTDALIQRRRPITRPRPTRAATPIISTRSRHAAAVPLVAEAEPWLEEDATTLSPMKPITRRQENKRTRVDYLARELNRIGRSNVAPNPPSGRTREHRFNHRSLHGKRTYLEDQKRHAADYIPPLEKATTMSLVRILASYLRYVSDTSGEVVQAGRMTGSAMGLSREDMRFLARKNFDLEDVEAWAAMITEPDSFKAASSLQARVASHGVRSIPLPVFSYMLRRPYITTRALRILIVHAWNLFAELDASEDIDVSPDAVFVVFIRLSRHAREVWPEALPSIADYLVRFLPDIKRNNRGYVYPSANAVSFMLNKAMYLISEPTAVAPFVDTSYQEAAVIRILSSMAEHDPPIVINREGYRAVIRSQLASQKTPREKQWAGLKALSWPPWKEDRTNMDSEIGPEHGISRAGASLQRMQEAGYALASWEKVAKLFTGWDVDGTPTIQTRVVLPIWGEHVKWNWTGSHEASIWIARIKTTRTVQEAWACYQAFEDAGNPPDQGVILAILEKLHQEERRQRRETRPARRDVRLSSAPQPTVYPGDAKEIEPLPPSTHLYTYTRTDPPTAHEFYKQLQEHDIGLLDQCLAYLITNAVSAHAGRNYIRSALHRHPALRGVIGIDPAVNFDEVPDVLFQAYVELLSRLSRYGKAVEPMRFSTGRRKPPTLYISDQSLAETRFNFQSGLVQAVWLLQMKRSFYRPTWNAVLDALARNASYKVVHLTNAHNGITTDQANIPDLHFNAILAYRLMQQVLEDYQDQYMAPDPLAFLAICRATENLGIACWSIISNDHYRGQAPTDGFGNDDERSFMPARVSEAEDVLAYEMPQRQVSHYFKLLVGDRTFSGFERNLTPPERSGDQSASSPGLPRLLAIPSPAILHAYIRALGWCGSHNSIIEALQWMVEYQEELAEAAPRARNSFNVMRRAVVAARVFLERSWLPSGSTEPDGFASQEFDVREDALSGMAQAARQIGENTGGKPTLLQMFESPASAEQIEQARALIDSVPDWGGWATEEEVEAYCQNGRFA